METYFANISATEGTRERLVEDLMTLVRDAENLVQTAGGGVADKSKQQLMKALERVKGGCRKLEEQATAREQSADRVIREHPYESMGIALGVGLLIGLLVSRD
jgi:ElaB/YqjD/DUF883 family membrane-anchored ribosome-binding protein